ncbi:MAG: retroviral-like aspartic protease family protein [Gammaproteobacteria bacterium]
MNALLHFGWRRGVWLPCALLCAMPLGAVEALSAPDPDQPLFAVPTQLDRIGRILAPVMINGKGPFRLIIDTGANHSTISPRLVEKLGLVPSEDVVKRVLGVTGSANMPTVFIERLQAGTLVVEGTYLPVIGSSMTADSDGILGVAGLQNARVIVDFRRDRVSITRNLPREPANEFMTIDAGRMPDGVLTVGATIRGVRAKAIIDTGAERTLGNLALLDALRHRGKRRGEPRWTDVTGATEQIAKGESVVAATVHLGDVVISHVDVTYGDFPIFKSWGLEDRPAMLVGMDVLGVADMLVIDFHNREVRVRSVTRPYASR